MSRIYVNLEGKRYEYRYKIHKIQCTKCADLNKADTTKQITKGHVKYCDQHKIKGKVY